MWGSRGPHPCDLPDQVPQGEGAVVEVALLHQPLLGVGVAGTEDGIDVDVDGPWGRSVGGAAIAAAAGLGLGRAATGVRVAIGAVVAVGAAAAAGAGARLAAWVDGTGAGAGAAAAIWTLGARRGCEAAGAGAAAATGWAGAGVPAEALDELEFIKGVRAALRSSAVAKRSAALGRRQRATTSSSPSGSLGLRPERRSKVSEGGVPVRSSNRTTPSE